MFKNFKRVILKSKIEDFIATIPAEDFSEQYAEYVKSVYDKMPAVMGTMKKIAMKNSGAIADVVMAVVSLKESANEFAGSKEMRDLVDIVKSIPAFEPNVSTVEMMESFDSLERYIDKADWSSDKPDEKTLMRLTVDDAKQIRSSEQLSRFDVRSQRLVSMHGGNITANIHIGNGTNVVIIEYLPSHDSAKRFVNVDIGIAKAIVDKWQIHDSFWQCD